MNPLRYALALVLVGSPIAAGVGLQGCAWWIGRGRVLTSPCRHFGVRGATDLSGVAVTVQVSTDDPVCPYVYPPTKDTP